MVHIFETEEPFYLARVGNSYATRKTFAEALQWVTGQWPGCIADSTARIDFYRYYKSERDCPNREVMIVDMNGVYP